MLDLTGREFYVTGVASPEPDGRENITSSTGIRPSAL
jgi:hypothetical protein